MLFAFFAGLSLASGASWPCLDNPSVTFEQRENPPYGPVWFAQDIDYYTSVQGTCAPPCAIGGGGNDSCLDVYLPTTPTDRPTVLFFHGGGLRKGDKAGYDTFRELLGRGYPVVSANYTLRCPPANPSATCGAQPSPPVGYDYRDLVRDVLQVMAWIRDADPTSANECLSDTVVVTGSSAGAFISAMLGTLWNNDPGAFLSTTLPDETFRPDLVVGFSGVYDLDALGRTGHCTFEACASCFNGRTCDAGPPGMPSGYPCLTPWPVFLNDLPAGVWQPEWFVGQDWGPAPPTPPANITGLFGSNPFAEISPNYRVDACDVPMALYHNRCDPIAPWGGATLMKGALDADGVASLLVPIGSGEGNIVCAHDLSDLLTPSGFADAIEASIVALGLGGTNCPPGGS